MEHLKLRFHDLNDYRSGRYLDGYAMAVTREGSIYTLSMCYGYRGNVDVHALGTIGGSSFDAEHSDTLAELRHGVKNHGGWNQYFRYQCKNHYEKVVKNAELLDA